MKKEELLKVLTMSEEERCKYLAEYFRKRISKLMNGLGGMVFVIF